MGNGLLTVDRRGQVGLEFQVFGQLGFLLFLFTEFWKLVTKIIHLPLFFSRELRKNIFWAEDIRTNLIL